MIATGKLNSLWAGLVSCIGRSAPKSVPPAPDRRARWSRADFESFFDESRRRLRLTRAEWDRLMWEVEWLNNTIAALSVGRSIRSSELPAAAGAPPRSVSQLLTSEELADIAQRSERLKVFMVGNEPAARFVGDFAEPTRLAVVDLPRLLAHIATAGKAGGAA